MATRKINERRYRRGAAQAISIPSNAPKELLPWMQSVVQEINNLRDDLERVRKNAGEDSIRKQ